MIKNLDDDQKQQAIMMGMMSAGAAMMDPRGTFGSAGASINRGLNAGLGTALPMMQWMQRTNEKEDDKKYQRKQDRIANRFRQNQQVLQEMQLKANENYRKASLDMQGRQVGLAEAKYKSDLARQQAGASAYAQFMDDYTKGVPNPAFAAAPPPMSINQATGQPYGMPNVPARVPMTEQEAYLRAGQLGAAYDYPSSVFTPALKQRYDAPDMNQQLYQATYGDPKDPATIKAKEWLDLRQKTDPFLSALAGRMNALPPPMQK